MERRTLESQDVTEHAINLLDQWHSFFSRIDTKSSVILGIDTGMMGYLASKLPSPNAWDLWMIVALVPIVLIIVSMAQLYYCSFPQLNGGYDSLVFFKEIAKRTEARFISDFMAQSHEELMQDMLGQVWRNSEILTFKFACLRRAYIFCACAVIPWACAVAVFVTR